MALTLRRTGLPVMLLAARADDALGVEAAGEPGGGGWRFGTRPHAEQLPG